MAKRKKTKVKVVTISYGLFGRDPHNRRIEKAMSKWLGRGYVLQTREEDPPRGCLRLYGGKTHLTFVQEAE